MKSSLGVLHRALVLHLLVLGSPALSFAASIQWTNTAGGNWNVAANWNPNQIPVAGDTAIVTNAGTYTVLVNVNTTLAGLELGGATGTQTLSVASATLTLSNVSTVAARGALLLNGGTLVGTGTLTVDGRFDWQSGTLQGAGQTVLTPGALVTLSTTGQKNFRDHTLTLQGLCTWTGGQWYGGYGATVNVASGAVLDVQTEAGAIYWFGTINLNNAGTIRKSTGTGTASIQWAVPNAGTIEAQSGTLALAGGGWQTGLFATTAANTRVHFSGGIHDLQAGVNFAGPGLFTIGDSATVRVFTPIVTGLRWQLLPGGILGGTSSITFTGPFDWQGGEMRDTGQTVFSPTATVTLSTSGQKNLRDRALTLQGLATWTGGQWYGGYSAVVNVANGAVLDVQTEAGAIYWFGTIALNNAGTVRKSAGTGTASLQWGVNNSGTIESQSGTLALAGGSSQSALLQTTTANARLHFSGGTHDLLAGVNFNGPGLFTIGDSATVRVLTPIATGLRWQLLPNGILGGTNSITFTGPFDWQGGTMSDAGQTIFSPTATVTLSTANQKNLRDRPLTLQGLATWTGGQWYGGYGAVLNVANGAVLDVQTEAGAIYWFGTIALNNAGTVRKSAGTGTASIQWGVNNTGTIESQSGTLALAGGGSQSALLQTTTASARLHFSAGTHDLLGGVNFNGPGLFTLGDSATVRVQTPIVTGARWQLLPNGTLGGTHPITFTGSFDWQGGTMSDAGQTVFSPTATVTLSTANQKNLRDRTLTLQGLATWTGGQWYGGYGAVLNVANGAVLDVQTEAGAIVWFGTMTLNNAGTVRKSTGPGTASIQWGVNNTGTVESQSGTLALAGGGSHTALLQTTTASSRLHFGGGTHDLLAGVNFNGPGLFTLGDSATVRVLTPIVTGLRWQLLPSGILGGTNSITFTGSFDWQGGTMSDAGQTVFSPSATVTLSTANQKNLRDRALTLAGTATWSGGAWYGGYGAVVRILNGGTLDAQSTAGAPVWFSSMRLDNYGTIRKSAGSGTASFQWTVTNYAQVRAQSGTLAFSGSFVQTSGATLLEGGNLAGTLLDIRGGELRGAGNIAADVRNWSQVFPGGPLDFLWVSNSVAQIYSNTAAGQLNLELGGLLPGLEHDQLRVNGPANLAGTLNVDFFNGFLPAVGNSFTVMTYTARSGQFSSIVSPPGITLQAAYFPTHLVLSAVTVTQVPPYIITQPTNLTLPAGLTATFHVTAGGTPALAYQWQMNGTNLPGATSDTLVLPGITVTNAGSYRVIVSNLGGQTNSVNALLLVQPGFQSLQLTNASTNVLVGSAFFNGRDGVIIASNGTLQVTRDGGGTWMTVNAGMTNLTDVQFLNGAIFIVGQGAHTICVSYDGGTNWSAAYTGPERIQRLRLLNSTNGFAVGDDGAVIHWDGSGWTALDTPIDVRLLGVDYCGGVPVVAGEAGQIWRFEGTNWVQVLAEVNLQTFNDVRFCGNGSVGLAVGTGGIVYRTTDCGLTWTPYENPVPGVDLHSIAFGDCSTLWVAGDDGTLLQSTDGGQTWGVVHSGTTNSIREVVFIDGYGYYVDDGGHIHRFIFAPLPPNPPPRVALTQPAGSITNWACVPIFLRADASDTNGFVTRVEFFADTTSLTIDSAPSWRGAWTNELLGNFTLTAVATDNQGATAVSEPVQVTFVLPPLHRLIPVGFLGHPAPTNTAFKLCMTGEPGRAYEVYAHTNVAAPFVTWDYLGLMMANGELFGYLDYAATNYPYRFYRARQVP